MGPGPYVRPNSQVFRLCPGGCVGTQVRGQAGSVGGVVGTGGRPQPPSPCTWPSPRQHPDWRVLDGGRACVCPKALHPLGPQCGFQVAVIYAPRGPAYAGCQQSLGKVCWSSPRPAGAPITLLDRLMMFSSRPLPCRRPTCTPPTATAAQGRSGRRPAKETSSAWSVGRASTSLATSGPTRGPTQVPRPPPGLGHPRTPGGALGRGAASALAVSPATGT